MSSTYLSLRMVITGNFMHSTYNSFVGKYWKILHITFILFIHWNTLSQACLNAWYQTNVRKVEWRHSRFFHLLIQLLVNSIINNHWPWRCKVSFIISLSLIWWPLWIQTSTLWVSYQIDLFFAPLAYLFATIEFLSSNIRLFLWCWWIFHAHSVVFDKL